MNNNEMIPSKKVVSKIEELIMTSRNEIIEKERPAYIGRQQRNQRPKTRFFAILRKKIGSVK
jgi:hypothetical protein